MKKVFTLNSRSGICLFFLVFILFLSEFVLIGCPGISNNKEDDEIDKSTIMIGIVMPDRSGVHVKNGNFLKTAVEDLGYKVRLELPDGGTQEEQNVLIKELIDAGAKVLIIDYVYGDSIQELLSEAKAKEIKVIAYDRLIRNTVNYDYYVTFNNYAVGQMQGEAIIEGLNLTESSGSKQITLFAGDLADTNATFFFNGAMNKLQPYITDNKLTVVGSSNISDVAIPSWNPANVKDRMDSIFTTGNTIKAVLAPNDYVAQYIIQNYWSTFAQSPIITGQDAEFISAKLIKEGKQYMTVFKDHVDLAADVAIMVDKIIEGKSISGISGLSLATGDLAEMGNTGVGKVPTFIQAPSVIKQDNLKDLIDADWFTTEQDNELNQ